MMNMSEKVTKAPSPKKTAKKPSTKATVKNKAAKKKTVPSETVSTISVEEAAESKKFERYIEAVGRRKSAVARVRLFTKPGDFLVNGRPYNEYFPTLSLRAVAEDALRTMKLMGKFRVSVRVLGGGSRSQAEAVRHALSRCLVQFNPTFRKRLKKSGFLRRDPRVKERKKFGLKKARRAPQWAKR